MNKTFRTLWSAARGAYVVTDETHHTFGKPSKVTLALALSAALWTGAAQATYTEQGVVAETAATVPNAVASWQTREYLRDWGLTAMEAADAYALGYHGQNVKLGVMDSGALLQVHPDLRGERFHPVRASGKYSRTGNRYPQGAAEMFDATYEKGESFDVTGDWKFKMNDSHGTHVLGSVGANRDGVEFHGVSWGSDIFSGNTGGTDSSNYGPFLDYGFFLAGWSALVETGAKVINNSFGTNTRIVPNEKRLGRDGFDISDMLPINTVQEMEYEYFLFQRVYGEEKDFVDAAYESVKDTSTVLVMTTGNRDMRNPYYRANYPYFNPEAERNWVGAAALRKLDGEGATAKYSVVKEFDEAGTGKWWTLAGTGGNIYSSAVIDGDYCIPGDSDEDGNSFPKDAPYGSAAYATWSGTSMAAPHITGAMGVILSRYPDMSGVDAKTVLFTTANHKNPDGSNMEGWDNRLIEGQVSDRLGWGTPNLKTAMYGPKQFLGEFTYRQDKLDLDVWSNNINQVAWDQRRAEDTEWMKITQNGQDVDAEGYIPIAGGDPLKIGGEFVLGEDYTVVGIENDKITVDEAKQWRSQFYAKRANAIAKRLAKNESGLDGYDGALRKSGNGTLIMTGLNTYRGGTTVENGKLLGFTSSFGISANGNGQVVVKNGQFGILNTYVDKFTKTGLKQAPKAHSVDVTVEPNGLFVLPAGETVDLAKGTVKFDRGRIAIDSLTDEQLSALNAGTALVTTLKAQAIDGQFSVVNTPNCLTMTQTSGNQITITIVK